MQCEKCKIKRATVFFTELDKTRHALCSGCAAENGKCVTEKDIFLNYTPISYMYELVNCNSRIYYINDSQDHTQVCPACKTELSDLLSYGRMGCPKCYSVFDSLIQFSDFKQLNYSSYNLKMPRRYAIRKETEKLIVSLREKLNDAIKNENYEYAARIRDEIKALSVAQKGI